MKRAWILAPLTLGLAVACSSSSSGSGSSTAAVSGYMNDFGNAYCAWLDKCGTASSGVSGCLTDYRSSKEYFLYSNCVAANNFYLAHKTELDACLSASPACGGSDPKSFCAILGTDAWNSIESQCKSSGTTDGGGTSSGTTCTTKSGGTASAGDYRCLGGAGALDRVSGIEVCKNGAWVSAASCSCTVSVGDPRKPPYSTSCTPGKPSDGSAVCEYAGSACLTCTKGGSCN